MSQMPDRDRTGGIQLPDKIPRDGRTRNVEQPVKATRIHPFTKQRSTVTVLNVDTDGPGTIIQSQSNA